MFRIVARQPEYTFPLSLDNPFKHFDDVSDVILMNEEDSVSFQQFYHFMSIEKGIKINDYIDVGNDLKNHNIQSITIENFIHKYRMCLIDHQKELINDILNYHMSGYHVENNSTNDYIQKFHLKYMVDDTMLIDTIIKKVDELRKDNMEKTYNN